jgi:hypothetical protein
MDALGLKRADFGTQMDLELKDKQMALQEKLQNASMANQRAMTAMNRPNYDLSFLSELVDSKRNVQTPQAAADQLVERVSSLSGGLKGILGNILGVK